MSLKAELIVKENARNNSARDDGDKEEEIDESVLDAYMTDDKRIAPGIIEGLRSNSRNACLEAATKLSQLANHREKAAIQPILDSDLLQTLVNIMSSEDVELQLQAIRVLAVITSGSSEQTSAVVEEGALPKLIGLASSTESDDIREDAFIALGNIGTDSQHLRTKLIQAGGLNPPLDVLTNPSTYANNSVYHAAFALSQYTHPSGGKPPGYEVTERMIPVISKYVLYQQDETAGSLQHSLLSLSRILIDDVSIDKARDVDLIPRLVHLCTSKETETRQNAHLCVNKILVSSVDGGQDLINAGIMDVLKTWITSEDDQARQDACFVTSNMGLNTFSHAEALMEAGLVPLLAQVLSDQGDTSGARDDAAYTLSTMAINWGQDHQEILDTILEANALEALCTALTLADYGVVEISLQGIFVLVKRQWNGRQRAVERVKAGDGIEQLRRVRFRNDIYRTEMHKLAQTILTNSFPEFSMPARM